MSGFDPIIALNVRIALLQVLESAKEYVQDSKGLNQAIAKIVGTVIISELEKSKRIMKENNMWVDDIPIRERRYRFSSYGRRGEHEATQAELEVHLGIVLRTLEHKFKNLPHQ